MSFRAIRWLAWVPLVVAQVNQQPPVHGAASTSTAVSSVATPSASGSQSLSESATPTFSLSSASSAFSSDGSVISASYSDVTSSISAAASTSSASNASISTTVSSASESTVTSLSSFSYVSSPATTTRHLVPISSYTFSPLPSPTGRSGIQTDPHIPPAVGASYVPDYSSAWTTAYTKAKNLVAKMTLEEKVNVTTGIGWAIGRCVGNTPALPAHNYPGLCLEDSPLGVRFADYVTSFPTGVNAAATWNRRLIRLRGLYMGLEHYGKGVNVALGPMMNIGRVAQGGRNWEGFGADPYLSGEAAYETVLGMQEGGVQACAKHLINNEQEHKRTQESSDVDDRTQHEIYAHPFMRSVMAGVASMMCSYNLINATYACENDKIMNDIVKKEYGFQGYIMSDWQATMSTISAITGLDMTMPGDVTFDSGDSYFGGNLTAYVHNETIPETRVDDMASRILAAWYFLHQDDATYPDVNFDAFLPDNEATNAHIDVQDDHYKLVRDVGAASTVLLKNVGGALPLKKPRSLVLIGTDAGPGRVGPNGFADHGGDDGTLASGWGSGTANFTYLITPLEAIQARARKDRTSVSWVLDDFDLPRAGNDAIRKSAALVFINSDSGEDYITVDGNEGDRKNLTAWHGGDDLVLTVAAQNNNTIVVVHSVGPLIVEPWIEHPNVTAVLWAGAPGTESGNSLVDVLYGDWNPSGRLPYTIAKSADDYNAPLITGGTDEDILNIPYTEGLHVDYRHFDAYDIEPRFEFGFGLSYTNFSYTNLVISKISGQFASSADAQAWGQGNTSATTVGSSTAAWLHEPAYNVTFNVQNTGPVYGGDIPQLYLHHPHSAGEPPAILRGFTNVEIWPGDTALISLALSRYDVSIWDVEQQGWRKPHGSIGVTVGRSSRDGKLHGKLPS
ncbi:glycoside hydrolase family 3 protein [Armillaria mellea]|nr:glycoside hydrolase family 3 protein [Armillaria mellea]